MDLLILHSTTTAQAANILPAPARKIELRKKNETVWVYQYKEKKEEITRVLLVFRSSCHTTGAYELLVKFRDDCYVGTEELEQPGASVASPSQGATHQLD
ncbi:MAG TPA: hypothetical protein VFW23_10690 [Tepidisphaeraceae bacterium]|nr:hypothetical protein [Tepidisphaeraceae bacterium]